MKLIQLDKKLTDEAYFLYEVESELKHELIHGELSEMSGVSIFHNDIAGEFYFFLRSSLKEKNWKVVFENFKIKTTNGNFFYPDIAVCFPDVQRYFSEQPALIVEVLSDTTRKYDLADKFIQYQKLPTLQYYASIKHEQQVVVCYQKQDSSSWTAETFTQSDKQIMLRQRGISFSLKDIYQS